MYRKSAREVSTITTVPSNHSLVQLESREIHVEKRTMKGVHDSTVQPQRRERLMTFTSASQPQRGKIQDRVNDSTEGQRGEKESTSAQRIASEKSSNRSVLMFKTHLLSSLVDTRDEHVLSPV